MIPAQLTPQALANALPTFPSGSNFANLATSIYKQIKTGLGVLVGLVVNTIGTTSTIELYDGTSSPVTITLASPGAVSWPAHNLAAGAAVQLQTTGALPTGLTAGTTYYVSSLDLAANSFLLADTKAHAIAGTNSINTSGSQSGVQTAYDVSNPIGTFSTVAQASLPIGVQVQNGIIAVAADGGGAANLTVLYM
jgi:hypothetical protein